MSAIGAGWLYVGWGAVLFETYYGLMQQHSPFEIKERLLKALDKEYNVVDMAAVLEIVTILERTPITKEALETTRLGRDINELRRKTRNESLAKRAKDLVRRWRDLILPQQQLQQQNDTPTTIDTVNQQNGSNNNYNSKSVGVLQQTPLPITTLPPLPPSSIITTATTTTSRTIKTPNTVVISPVLSTANIDKSNISPGLSNRMEAVPRTHAANKRLRKDMLTSAYINETIKPSSESSSPELPINKKIKLETTTTTTDTIVVVDDDDVIVDDDENKQQDQLVDIKLNRLNGDHHGGDSVSSDCEIVNFLPTTTATITANTTINKQQKLRNKKTLKGRKSNKQKNKSDDIVKEKIALIARVPKVKTTQELLAGLQQKSRDQTTIDNNCIDHDVVKNKTEHLARFLRSQQSDIGGGGGSCASGAGEDDDIEDVDEDEDNNDDDDDGGRAEEEEEENEVATKSSQPDTDNHSNIGSDFLDADNLKSKKFKQQFEKDLINNSVKEILSRLPPLDLEKIKWDDDDCDANVDETSSPKIKPSCKIENKQTTDTDVDRVLNQHIEGVNGNYDESGENSVFKEWHEVVSRTSYNGELIHILPYVVID